MGYSSGTDATGCGGRAGATAAPEATLSRYQVVSAASVNAVNVKTTAGRVYGWSFANSAATWRYVKLHQVDVAPTAGAGVVMTIAVPPGGTAQYYTDIGTYFTPGIGLTIVGGAANADATAIGLNEVTGTLFYA